MAHSPKSLRDHARNRSQPNIDNKVIAEQLEDLVKPCVYNQLLELITPTTLLLLDRGFWNYDLFEQLILAHSDFITRLKTNAYYESISILSQSSMTLNKLLIAW